MTIPCYEPVVNPFGMVIDYVFIGYKEQYLKMNNPMVYAPLVTSFLDKVVRKKTVFRAVEEETVEYKLTLTQEEAQLLRNMFYRVSGTGRTRSLADKIGKRLSEVGVDPVYKDGPTLSVTFLG